MSKRGLPLVTAAFALWIESASAVPLPFFYLVPTGPGTVPTVVPVGTTTYQLWVDPSGINSPGCTTNPGGAPINGACVGIIGVTDLEFLAHGALTMTAFTLMQVDPTGFDIFNLASPTELRLFTGDVINGNATPFEAGTLTIANSGSSQGDITLWSGDYLDTNFNNPNITAPQTIAMAAPVPEPGNMLLLGAGLGGFAVALRVRRTPVI